MGWPHVDGGVLVTGSFRQVWHHHATKKKAPQKKGGVIPIWFILKFFIYKFRVCTMPDIVQTSPHKYNGW